VEVESYECMYEGSVRVALSDSNVGGLLAREAYGSSKETFEHRHNNL
jgi:hypothetical protein